MAGAQALLGRLNDLQRQAALAPLDRPLLILAAAGTGKTSTLVARVAHMAAQGVPPESILVLTFSRKAVEDLTERMRGVAPCQLRTIHSFSHALLLRHWRRCGYTRPPTIIADEARVAALRRQDALRLAKLEQCKEQAAAWLGLPLGASWPKVLAAAAAEAAALLGGSEGNSHGRFAAAAATFERMRVQEQLALLADLLDKLCRRQDRTLWASLGDGELASVTAEEVARAWRWQAAARWQGWEDERLCGSTQQPTLATLRSVSQQQQHALLYERAGALYWRDLRRTNCAPLGELPALALDLLSQHADVLEEAQARWTHLLVDELQDLNQVQLQLVFLLQQGRGWITAVGDPAQRIMSFSHAVPAIFEAVRRRYGPALQETQLSLNYRCTQAICAVGNAALYGQRSSDSMTAAKPAGQPVIVRHYGSVEEEAVVVAAAIQQQLAAGRPPGDIAVLFRCLSLSGISRHGALLYKPLADELDRLGVKYYVRGGKEKAAAAEQLLCYLRVLVNPDDDGALHSLLALPRHGLGDAVLGALLELQRAERLAGSSCTLLSSACALCTAEPSDVAWCWEGLAGGEASHDGSDKAADKGSSAEQFELGFHACRSRLAALLARLAELRCELLDLPLPLALDHVAQLLASEAGIAAGAGGADPLEERQGAGEDAWVAALLQQAQRFFGAWEPPQPAAPATGARSLLRIALEAATEVTTLGQAISSLRGDATAAASAVAEELAAQGRTGLAPVRDFLSQLDEGGGTALEQEARADAVLLGTIHSAKGLEWGCVILPTLNEGFCPTFFRPELGSLEEGDDFLAQAEEHLREERRLFHVAATRAKDQLTLSYVQGHKALFTCPRTGEPRPMMCSHILVKVLRQLVPRSGRARQAGAAAVQVEGRLPRWDEVAEEEYGSLWHGIDVFRGASGGSGYGLGASSEAERRIAERRQWQAQALGRGRGRGVGAGPLQDHNAQGAHGGSGLAVAKRLRTGPGGFKPPRPAAVQ